MYLYPEDGTIFLAERNVGVFSTSFNIIIKLTSLIAFDDFLLFFSQSVFSLLDLFAVFVHLYILGFHYCLNYC